METSSRPSRTVVSGGFSVVAMLRSFAVEPVCSLSNGCSWRGRHAAGSRLPLLEALELLLELLHVLEIPVHRREAHVRDPVEVAQHHQRLVADRGGGHLVSDAVAEPCLD